MEPPSDRPYKYEARPTDDQVTPGWKPWLRVGLIGAAIAVLLVAGYGLLKGRKTEASIPVARLPSVTQWTADSGVNITPCFSHDGKRVAYASDREDAGNLAIWLQPYPSGRRRKPLAFHHGKSKA